MLNKKSVDDINVKGLRVLCRCDFNVPLKAGVITDANIHGNLIDILSGEKPGRENDSEFIYFNAVGLAYTDVSLANAMFEKAKAAGKGTMTYLQEKMIFEKDLAGKVKI